MLLTRVQECCFHSVLLCSVDFFSPLILICILIIFIFVVITLFYFILLFYLIYFIFLIFFLYYWNWFVLQLVIHLLSYLVQQDLGIISIWAYQLYFYYLGLLLYFGDICICLLWSLSKSLFDLSYWIRAAINFGTTKFLQWQVDSRWNDCARCSWFRKQSLKMSEPYFSESLFHLVSLWLYQLFSLFYFVWVYFYGYLFFIYLFTSFIHL